MAGIMPREECAECLAGRHLECINLILEENYCDCSHEERPQPQALSVIGNALNLDPDSSYSDDTGADGLSEVGKKTRRQKDDSAVRDQQSTGRKRAAVLYPLDRDKKCEWANNPAAGGGFEPIQGCGIRPATMVGRQQARHHGPDQNTLNNEPDNVHRICHSCHNTWHAANDKYKDKMYEKLYGVKPAMEDLSKASKTLISGKISGGKINEGSKE